MKNNRIIFALLIASVVVFGISGAFCVRGRGRGNGPVGRGNGLNQQDRISRRGLQKDRTSRGIRQLRRDGNGPHQDGKGPQGTNLGPREDCPRKQK